MKSDIIEYKVLSFYDTPTKLAKEVNSLLKEDWHIYGDIQIATNGSGTSQTIYSQVMVRYRDLLESLEDAKNL